MSGSEIVDNFFCSLSFFIWFLRFLFSIRIAKKMQIETTLEVPAKSVITSDELSLLFEPISLSTLAVESQFMKRQPKKITPQGFLFSFFQSVLSQNRALRNIAISAGLYAGCTISKQAVDYRINDRFIDFLQRILATLVIQHSGLKAEWAQTNELFRSFSRVLVQDSTTFPLDTKLISAFPGPTNKYGQSATAKIQTIMDLLSEQFCHLELGAFTENDQSKAADILKIARPGDLVIRDLGYFVLSSFRQMTQQAIFFLSRLHSSVGVYEPGAATRMDLLKALRENGYLDINVQLGAKERVPVRLVARPVSGKTLAERTRKAKTDRDLRLNHNEAYMALLAWDIFVTNVPPQIWTTEQACKVNQVRWRIEMVFKTWKSHFKLNAVPKGTATRVKAHIYAALIFATLFQKHCYLPLANSGFKNQKTDISPMKLAQFVAEYSLLILIMPYNPQLQEAIVQQLLYHCNYEKRNRQSYPQKFRTLF